MHKLLAPLAATLLAGPAYAAQVDFNALPAGTVLSNQYPCLTFSDPVANAPISVSPLFAGAADKVLAVGGDVAFNARHAAIDIAFCALQRSVSISAAAFREHYYLGTANARPYLQAFDAAGNHIQTVYFQGALPASWALTPFETLSIDAGSARIARIRLSSQGNVVGSVIDGVFDNLAYSLSDTADATMYEEFDLSTIGRRWLLSYQGKGIRSVIDKGQLQVEVSPSASGADIVHRLDATCQLRGDFDLRVDYRYQGLHSGVRSALVTPAGHVERTSMSKTDVAAAGDYYISSIAGYWPGFVPTRDSAGSLRLARSGDQLTSYTQRAGSFNWQPIYTQTVDKADLPFALQVWTHDWAYARTGAQVGFDNVALVSGQFVGKGCP